MTTRANYRTPPRLRHGDEIRVIAPARSLAIIAEDVRSLAIARLRSLGLRVTFGNRVNECDRFLSSSAESRLADIHEAFADPTVKGVFSVIGGFNSNQMLSCLDYRLIAEHPKIFCGYSDMTVLQNAITARCGFVTYSGPHFSSFGMFKGIEFTCEYFVKCLFDEEAFELIPSNQWSDDEWYRNQEGRVFEDNRGYLVLNEGEAEGVIYGGNLCTFNLLHGTDFMPPLADAILFFEDDAQSGTLSAVDFDRNLQSVIHQPGFAEVRGLVLGRFQKGSQVTDDVLFEIIRGKNELRHIPVIANVDFGHTTPQITFPIGGRCELSCSKFTARICVHHK